MHFLSLADWSAEALEAMIDEAIEAKVDPNQHAEAMARKVMVMIFEKPSLRTHLLV